MNREQIIRMAREAGFSERDAMGRTAFLGNSYDIERFAALVADAEREKLAAWMIQRGYATGHGDTIKDLLRELDWQIEERIRNEREACAKVCEGLGVHPALNIFNGGPEWYKHGKDCAAAIRARGQS